MAQTRPNAFTLIETVLSLAIVGVVAMSATSIVLLTSKAMPSADDADVANVSTRDIVNRIGSELSTATSIVAVAPHSIVFTVPDRDGDALEETFRYRWSGVAGEPLEWQYNGGTAITVASSVSDFSLVLNATDVSQTAAGPDAWGSEQLIYEHAGTLGTSVEVRGLTQIGQFVRPTMPSGATQWAPTRAVVQIKRGGSATQTPVLRGTFFSITALGVPDLTKNQATTYDGSGVTSTTNFTDVTFTATGTTAFASGSGAFFLLAPTLATTTNNSGNIGKATGVAFDPGYVSSTTNLLTWTVEQDAGLACMIYGKFYGPTTTTTSVRRATRATIALSLTTGGTAAATAQLLARPATP